MRETSVISSDLWWISAYACTPPSKYPVLTTRCASLELESTTTEERGHQVRQRVIGFLETASPEILPRHNTYSDSPSIKRSGLLLASTASSLLTEETLRRFDGVCSFMLCDLDFEPLSLSLSSISSRSLNLIPCLFCRLCHLAILCSDQRSHTMPHLESFKSELAEVFIFKS
ncbi:hypothetical protein Tco_0519382 [Tanacetum coccineum]